MPGLRRKNDWSDIGREDKLRIPGPVKDEKELMFRVLHADSAHGLKGEPTDTFQFPGNQQARVNRNLQWKLINFTPNI
jgi:hypothetical protein